MSGADDLRCPNCSSPLGSDGERMLRCRRCGRQAVRCGTITDARFVGEAFTHESITYKVISAAGSEAEVVRCERKTSGDIQIPSYLVAGTSFVKIARIGDGAFKGCVRLTSVKLPPTINAIGAHAFDGCRLQPDFPIPSGVERIGESAFQNVTGMSMLTVSGTVRDIGPKAFSKCQMLERVTLGAKVRTIGPGAFQNCPLLATVSSSRGERRGAAVMPNSIHEIGDSALAGTAITEMYCPSGTVVGKNNPEVREGLPGSDRSTSQGPRGPSPKKDDTPPPLTPIPSSKNRRRGLLGKR